MGQNEKIKHRKKITKRVSASFPAPIIPVAIASLTLSSPG